MYSLEKEAAKSKLKTNIIFQIIFANIFIFIVMCICQGLTELVCYKLNITGIYIDYALMYFAGAIIGGLLWAKFIEKNETPFNRIGFVKDNIIIRILTGFILGFIMISVTILLCKIFLGVNFSLNNISKNMYGVLIMFFFFIIQSTAEEVWFRGLLLPIISKRLGIKWGIIINAILFSALHGSNGGVDFLAIVNISLVGILMSYVVIYYESIWEVAFLHMAWNFFQGSFYGFNVSGTGLASSIFSVYTENTSLLSFGPESTIFATIVVLVACMIYHKKCKEKYNLS